MTDDPPRRSRSHIAWRAWCWFSGRSCYKCKRLHNGKQENGLQWCPGAPPAGLTPHGSERGTPMKVNKKGALALGAVIVGSMLALAGCAGGSGGAASSAPAMSGELTVWVDQNRADALKDIVKTFEDK